MCVYLTYILFLSGTYLIIIFIGSSQYKYFIINGYINSVDIVFRTYELIYLIVTCITLHMNKSRSHIESFKNVLINRKTFEV